MKKPAGYGLLKACIEITKLKHKCDKCGKDSESKRCMGCVIIEPLKKEVLG